MSDHYIHGFSEAERTRLIEQAEILAPRVFGGLDFSRDETLLEVGCAVGAELYVIHQRYPHLALTGLDRSRAHLDAGREWLAEREAIRLVEGDAYALPFPDDAFDVGMTIWLLEHVDDAAGVIRELLRVVKPSGRVILIEVDNRTFEFTPRQPAIADWWDAFSRCQAEVGGGDPFVGGKLRACAEELGAEILLEEPRHMVNDRTVPRDRIEQLEYLRDLLMSGAERMLRNGYADEDMQRAMNTEFDALRDQPEVHFQYGGVRLVCRPGGFQAE